MIFLVIALLFVAQSNGLTWKKINPSPTNGLLTSVSYGNGIYVFVGGNSLQQSIIVTTTNFAEGNWSLIDQLE